MEFSYLLMTLMKTIEAKCTHFTASHQLKFKLISLWFYRSTAGLIVSLTYLLDLLPENTPKATDKDCFTHPFPGMKQQCSTVAKTFKISYLFVISENLREHQTVNMDETASEGISCKGHRSYQQLVEALRFFTGLGGGIAYLGTNLTF